MHFGLFPVRDDVTVAIMGTQTKGNIFIKQSFLLKEKWNFYVRVHSSQPPGLYKPTSLISKNKKGNI